MKSDARPSPHLSEREDDFPKKCECDNTHQNNDTVCRWCWAHGRRKWDDPDVTSFGEREKIVAWLRKIAVETRQRQREYEPLSHGHCLYGDLSREIVRLADRIYIGDHISGEGR